MVNFSGRLCEISGRIFWDYARGTKFVTRIKDNAKTTRLKDDVIEEAENYGDYGFRFTQEQAQKVCGDTRFRLVQWHDLENDRWFEFLSNDFDLTAQQIADLYRKRWQIELFFKKLKQNLKIKSFIGTSENKCRDDSDLDSSRGYAVN